MALPDETALRLLAKRKIETGALPREAPESVFAGKGSGLLCSLCNQPVTANDYEFEYGNGGGKVPRFHLRCQEIWRSALAAWRNAPSEITATSFTAGRTLMAGRVAEPSAAEGRLVTLNFPPPSLGFRPPRRLIEPIGGAHMFGIPSNTPSSVFDELWRLQQEVDELFGSWGSPLGIRSLPRGSFPGVNVGQTPERVDVYLFAPGIDPKSLEISIQQNLLSVSGRRELRAEEEANYYRQERFSGEFRRVISLPEDVDPERVQAKYVDGIVQIGVQRRESARPRQIEIQ